MRIEHLTLERYGMFADRALSFHPEAVLHVVLGPNEAGKTSTLSAVGDLLFGFAARTEYDFKYDSKILRIGGAFRHSNGRTIVARRRKGNKHTLVDDADQPLPDDSLEPFLGGISRDTFSLEFGLTAKALREGGEDLLRAGGRLAETLAASSAGMTVLSRIKQQLEGEADNLFTTRRSGNKLFYLAADRRESADKMLRDAIVTREALQRLETDVQAARLQQEALNAEHAQSGGTLARLQRTLRVRSKLGRLERLGAELAALADLPQVSEQMLSEWCDALEAGGALGRDMAALDQADAAETLEIASMAVDEKLLSEGITIDALRERLGAVRKAVEDLPRRRQAREAAQTTLDDAARRLGLPSRAALLDQFPTDLAMALARELIDQTKHMNQVIVDATTQHARAQRELDGFEVEDGGIHTLGDTEQLRQRFEALGDVPAQAERLRRDTSMLSMETEGVAVTISSLQPSPGALDRLRALPLPDNSVIAKYSHFTEISESEVMRLTDALAAIDDEIAATVAELARVSGAGTVPTRANLVGARRKRDTHLDELRSALHGDRAARETRFAEVAQASQEIDRVTDLLLTDIERATRREDAQNRLVASRGERERIAARMTRLQSALVDLGAAWIQVWAAAGIVPAHPTEMLRWRERVDGVLTQLGKLDVQKADIDALDARLDSGKAAVVAFLESVGRMPNRALPPDILFHEAKGRFDELQAAWAEVKVRLAAKQRIQRDLVESESARDAARVALADQRQAWLAALTGIGLADQATLIQAETALSVWHSVAVPKASHERESRSVESIEADLDAFDRDVSDLVNCVAPQSKAESAQESLARLSAKLAETRSSNDSCQRLRKALLHRATNRKALIARRMSTEALLGDACSALGVTGTAALSEPIKRMVNRQSLEKEQSALQRELHEIADARDETTLRQERDGVDFDLLPGHIEREALRQTQLLKSIEEASAIHHQKQRELDILLRGRDASAAATERAESSAELLSIAEGWLLRSAACRLALRTIERHRAMVQDPLIARASILFAKATGEAFAGLSIDYDDNDQPVLVARRTDGERVQITGLSEGTRDQLFLTLRLALLEIRASEPMPFIGDDLLTSFDENRTLATLRLLAEAGKHRQIILFTHHRHVAELARSVQEHMIDLIHL